MENERSGISIVCREICKDTGEIAAYLCKKDVDNQDLFLVSIRSRANPELTYYAIQLYPQGRIPQADHGRLPAPRHTEKQLPAH